MKFRNRLAASFSLALAAALASAQTDVLSRLRVSAAEANERIFYAITSGSFSPAGDAAGFKNATPEVRAALAKGVMTLARTYSTTDDFKARYDEARRDAKPEAPDAVPSAAEVAAQQRKGLEEAIANAQKTAATMPAMKKELDGMIAELRKQLAQIGKDAAMNAQLDAAQKMQADANAASYKEDLAKWEKEWPADPKLMIIARLRAFLEQSGSVDFAAKTQFDGSIRKNVFVNPEYENKDGQWKLIYRAGKPAVDAARAAAQEWLKALGA